MIRIIGILCGSAIALAFLIIALGIPEFPPPDEVAEEAVQELFDVVDTSSPCASSLLQRTGLSYSASFEQRMRKQDYRSALSSKD